MYFANKKLRKAFKHFEGELISVQEVKNNKHGEMML